MIHILTIMGVYCVPHSGLTWVISTALVACYNGKTLSAFDAVNSHRYAYPTGLLNVLTTPLTLLDPPAPSLVYLLPRSSFNMGRKCSKLSTVSKVKEAVVQSSGNLKTLRSNLTKLEQVQSQLADNATARQLLAEAALEAGTVNNASADTQYPDYADMDFNMDQEEDYIDEEDGPQEEEDERASEGNGGYEGSAVDAARARVIYCFQGRHHHRWPPRSRLQRNRQCHSAWTSQMPALIAGYLRWKHRKAIPIPNVEAGMFKFDVSTVDILVSTPLISAWHKPSFSVQAMVKVLCALHNRSYFQALRDQFAIAFDAYLDILRRVQELVNIALKRDGPHWRMLHSCPACDYKQENEPTLIPARMDSMDGNSSLKRVDGSGHADDRVFKTSYLISPDEVDTFKDDVRLRPGTRGTAITDTAGGTTPTGVSESACTDNWKTANTISDNTVKTLAEMRRSGELAKYALATTNKVLDVYGLDGVMGYDIGCSYQKTVDASSISAKARSNHHRFIVNSFHGHTHNRRCQLQFHPLYQHGLGLEDLETSSTFIFSNGIPIGTFLYNNYQQALAIIDDLSPAVEELKLALKISDGDFERWNMEELEFLESLTEETEEDIDAMTYVDALQSLTRAEAAYGSITTVQFLTYTPADFTPSHGLQKNQQVFARAREAEHHAAHRKLVLEMNIVDDIERRMGITARWQPQDAKYQEGLAYLTNRQFICSVEQLQGLVIQRLFELAKANIAGTGYKHRQHISNAISCRSAAIRTALEKYNQLAIVQTPPREVLEFSEIASYAWLGKFDLLKHSRHCILEKPFNVLMKKFDSLNVEVARLSAWVDHKDAHFKATIESLVESDPTLSHEISCMYEERRRVNDVHRRRIHAISELPGVMNVTNCI
ncbi:uncharacterized protein EDB91DRAFT_1078128 [Suillus paluster]|uniref:uncharacterized protein n=1 Tax=Suillus paluster TaxID=48578 RepID=UPI001B883576|nr:uncharacterized protein EDB91DRAFT_1078128 [Suillus paluster]KAG1751317.1 hypothetical protein EDB91DRAFT_1078128 [Suillus paluster]